MVTSIIGMSVNKGAIATLIPSFLLWVRVSDMTTVNKGPGDIPAVSPKTIPVIANVIISVNSVEFYLVKAIS